MRREQVKKVESALVVIIGILGLLFLLALTSGCQKPIRRAEATLEAASVKREGERPVYLCGAPTRSGKPCTRRVKAEGLRCWQHKEK